MSEYGVVADPKWGTCVHGESPPDHCDKCKLELRIEALNEAIRSALDLLTGWTGIRYDAATKIQGAMSILNAALEVEARV